VLRPPCREPPPPPSSWSSLSPISFLATPTAAGTAMPSAAPATTFLPVDMPSFVVVFHFDLPFVDLRAQPRASLNESINLGMIRSLTKSGPFFARYSPAAPAAS
jgi:hypothetical protein